MSNLAPPQSIQVLCTNGLKSVFEAVGDALSRRTGRDFRGGLRIHQKVHRPDCRGGAPDVVILTDEAIDSLIALGKLAGGRDRPCEVVHRRCSPPGHTASGHQHCARIHRDAARSPRDIALAPRHQRPQFATLLSGSASPRNLAPKIKVYDGTPHRPAPTAKSRSPCSRSAN